MPDLDPINQRVAAVAQVAAALLGGIVAKDGFDAAVGKGTRSHRVCPTAGDRDPETSCCLDNAVSELSHVRRRCRSAFGLGIHGQ